ncbi:hypothetical protein MMC25_007409 [Agyrium rufum]|nr:hypothetical protein [Agyrium rufum]
MAAFYAGDTCALKDDPSILAFVERTWRDVDAEPFEPPKWMNNPSVPGRLVTELFENGLPPQGYVLVEFVAPHTECTLVNEKDLILIDREFLTGDVVKRRSHDAASGTIIRTSNACTLQPIYTGLPFPGHSWSLKEDDNILRNIPAEELKMSEDFVEGTYIIYRDWIGTIDIVYDEITIRLSDGSVVVVENTDDMGVPAMGRSQKKGKTGKPGALVEKLHSRLAGRDDGKKAEAPDFIHPGMVVVTTKGNLRRGHWKYGAYNPNISPRGIVVEVRETQIGVTWLTSNVFKADRTQKETPPMLLTTDEFGTGDVRIYDEGNLPHELRSAIGAMRGSRLAAGDNVRFRDVAGAALKYSSASPALVTQHGSFRRIPRLETQGYDMNVLLIRETKLFVTVQWQDGSRSDESATNLIPYLNVDEHDVWPGEIIRLKGDIKLDVDSLDDFIKIPNIGLVLSTNARERMAKVRWFSRPNISILSSNESVLLPGSSLGELTGPEADLSLYDIACCSALTRRRGDLILVAPETQEETDASRLGFQEAAQSSGVLPSGVLNTAINLLNWRFSQPPSDLPTQENPAIASNLNEQSRGDIDWFGTVVDLCLDGTLQVRLAAADPIRDIYVKPEKATLVSGGDDDSLLGSEAMEDDSDDESLDSDDDSVIGSQESYDSEDVIEEVVEYEGGTRLDDDETDAMWMTDEEENTKTSPDSDVAGTRSDSSLMPSPIHLHPDGFGASQIDEVKFTAYTGMPAQFVILEGHPPSNHHYVNNPTELGAPLMRRIRKEHKIMQNSIPDGIWVRTWEERLDLLRILIIGPQETPYTLAPFVIDFRLPSNFPDMPPEAYFHSWTNGAGRINPNLYEDGKICLSLLGTWNADKKNEGWSASRSSMLQVIVSLMGLVLVKEPYYNEAGYEALKGSADSEVTSNMYSERVLVLAKGFVTHALSHEIEGLHDVISWIYKPSHGKGPELLDRIMKEAAGLLVSAESDLTPSMDGADAMDIDGGNKRTRDSQHMMHLSAGAKVMLKRYLDGLTEAARTCGYAIGPVAGSG